MQLGLHEHKAAESGAGWLASLLLWQQLLPPLLELLSILPDRVDSSETAIAVVSFVTGLTAIAFVLQMTDFAVLALLLPTVWTWAVENTEPLHHGQQPLLRKMMIAKLGLGLPN